MKNKIYKYQIGKYCKISDNTYIANPSGELVIFKQNSMHIKELPIPKLTNKYKTKLWKLNKAMEDALGVV